MCHVDFVLFRILALKNSSRKRINWLNDFKMRLDRVDSFLKDVEQVRTRTSFYHNFKASKLHL
jgi:hypothetical protein